jgi:hypothetical protein
MMVLQLVVQIQFFPASMPEAPANPSSWRTAQHYDRLAATAKKSITELRQLISSDDDIYYCPDTVYRGTTSVKASWPGVAAVMSQRHCSQVSVIHTSHTTAQPTPIPTRALALVRPRPPRLPGPRMGFCFFTCRGGGKACHSHTNTLAYSLWIGIAHGTGRKN